MTTGAEIVAVAVADDVADTSASSRNTPGLVPVIAPPVMLSGPLTERLPVPIATVPSAIARPCTLSLKEFTSNVPLDAIWTSVESAISSDCSSLRVAALPPASPTMIVGSVTAVLKPLEFRLSVPAATVVVPV